MTEDILLGTPLCITFLIVMVCSSKCIPPMIPWKTPITPQFKSQLLPSHCSSILKLRSCITFENLFINYLKPCKNKEGQSFVVLLGFCMPFFKIKNWASQQTFGSSYYLFCQGFSMLMRYFGALLCTWVSTWYSPMFSLTQPYSFLITLLGSGSEWPKDQTLLLTMVSYFKKRKREKRKKPCEPFWK